MNYRRTIWLAAALLAARGSFRWAGRAGSLTIRDPTPW